MTDSYEDILNLPRPVSGRHPRMPIEDRAAQFAPFSALSGYEDAIREAAKQAEESARDEYGTIPLSDNDDKI